MPKLSFVVPTHNRIEWVAECVGSLLAQSESDIEVIVVDDGSTDGTYEMLTDWLKNETRAVIVRNEASLGAGKSRNRGTELARADIIGVCDDDDFYSVDRAKRTLAFFEKNPGPVMYNAPYLRVDHVDDPVEKFPGAEFDEKAFKEKGDVNYFCHPTAAYRKHDFREIGGYHAETEKQTDDYQFVKDWIGAGKKIGFDPEEFVCFHRVLPDSIMAKHRGFNPEWNKTNGNN